MFHAFRTMRLLHVAFAAFALFMFGTSAYEIISEFSEGQDLMDMSDDMARFGLSSLVLVAFIYERHVQRREIRDLHGQLNNARGKLAEFDQKSRELACQYRAVMQRQFEAWELTPSEQDVVIAMLKGLSFREIAQMRETREKTVRQQASNVYRKAGVSSRNELSAWFFEDMLDPPSL